MNFLAPQPTQTELLSAAKDALSSENQQIRPVRQEKHTDDYSLMLQKVDSKPSAQEILQAFSHH